MAGVALWRLFAREWVLPHHDLGLPGWPSRHGLMTIGAEPDRFSGCQFFTVARVFSIRAMAHFTLNRAVSTDGPIGLSVGVANLALSRTSE